MVKRLPQKHQSGTQHPSDLSTAEADRQVGVLTHACAPSTTEAEMGRSLGIADANQQLGLIHKPQDLLKDPVSKNKVVSA